jgi:hypothetical protein
MESLTTYEKSIEELNKIKKNVNSDTLTINFNKLDSETTDQLRKAITNVVFKRSSECNSVIMNNNG